MASVKGSVSQLYVTDGWAKSVIEDAATGDSETVVVWSDYAEEYSPQQRLVHGNWMAMLREGLVNRLTVEVVHPDDSSLVSSVYIYS